MKSLACETGQQFSPATLEKLRQARKLIDDSGRDIRLEVDGCTDVMMHIATLKSVVVAL